MQDIIVLYQYYNILNQNVSTFTLEVQCSSHVLKCIEYTQNLEVKK